MRTHLNRSWPRIGRTSRRGRTARLALLSVALVSGVGVAVSFAGQAPLREFRWEQLQQQGGVESGTVLPPEPGSSFHSLSIANPGTQPMSVTVLTIDAPALKTQRYGVTGQVRYEGVDGTGYLEMWNHFPGGGQYFSRTLADQGPMMKLAGTSAWRPFSLPFDATGAPPPTRLVVNVVLPGKGTVVLGPLRLAELDEASGWLDEARLDRLAGLAGALLGVVGGLIGVLTGMGRARRLVIGATVALIAGGVLSFAAGVLAAATSQTLAGSYPFLLVGFLASVLPLGLLPVIRRRYEEVELRTMRAHDVG